jgi:protein-tyrosine phosphatase
LVGVSLPTPTNPSKPYRICLVCLGNICRSPIAEVVLRDRLRKAGLEHAVAVDSAGTGDWHIGEDMDRRSRNALERGGYDADRHRARQFAPDWFDRRDLVLAMDERNLANLRRMAPGGGLEAGRVGLFGSYGDVGAIPDPYVGADDGFTYVLTLVERAADQLTAELADLLTR